MPSTRGFLGIDAGTQGLSVIFTNESLDVLATGEGGYEMVPDLADGCYEQRPGDWERALSKAMASLRGQLEQLRVAPEVLCVGISGQMHGEVLADRSGNPLGPARLWCDSRNEAEADELTKQFGVKMPKRITAARWLWTIRNQPAKAAQAHRMTTPAGWIAFRLTGEWTLGIGDAAGMFPIDQATLNYDENLLGSFDAMVGDTNVPPLRTMLPAVRKAGESGGALDGTGETLLGLPAGTPVAPAEGDQPAALAGSLIGAAGMVSVSYGTSVCANSVGDRAFQGVHRAVDHFCAPDGKPINMVWLRNGTTFMNAVVEMFGLTQGGDRAAGFSSVMPQLLEAASDCDGLLALPFMDDEPGLGVSRGGTALVAGLNPENATPGNVAKAALLATVFNLRIGGDVLDAQGFPRNEIILSGGLTKTPELGQVLADALRTPVTVLETAEEGTAWGAALMAQYRFLQLQSKSVREWSAFLEEHASASPIRFVPDEAAAAALDAAYARYRRLLELQPSLDEAIAS